MRTRYRIDDFQETYFVIASFSTRSSISRTSTLHALYERIGGSASSIRRRLPRTTASSRAETATRIGAVEEK